ncbi:DNA polymerase delta small subunit-like isoform X1 [Juglans microcarpa x Juglans regia]|uniref:DNA polymerase delta small subunit-like isoform X1 n=1 Tax=Juglans microcarpa x Juglans regia TaxID=2249226 RepID=UPI001B7E7EC6|nr:DNA polymerase delta small subunit-like isoform X1 [Juglans microcarpa x Juglans regia]
MAEVLTRVRFRYLCRLLLDLRYYFIPSFPIGNPIYQFAQFAIGLEEGKECILAGTLNMHMKLKPCVLDEYSEERSATRLVKPHNFVHPDDKLVLEQNSGRVKLAGNVPLASGPNVTSLFHDKHIIPSEENSFSQSDRSKLVFF